VSSPASSAREDQIREARARMAAEGEPVPQRPASERGDRQRPGGFPQRPGNSQQRRGRRGGGRGNGAGRNARQEQYDPRRSEPREPAYAQQPQKPARQPVVIQKKRSFAGMMGALLGRKRETEE
jgi:hypothetical protein